MLYLVLASSCCIRRTRFGPYSDSILVSRRFAEKLEIRQSKLLDFDFIERKGKQWNRLRRLSHQQRRRRSHHNRRVEVGGRVTGNGLFRPVASPSFCSALSSSFAFSFSSSAF